MLRFNDIADKVLENQPDADLALLQRAYVFAAKVHEGQQRLSGEPYLVHPLEVAGILADMRLDEASVAAGLLHDTLEDTLTTLPELRRLFGDEVAVLVEGLTKIAKIEFTSARERQAENFRKMLIAMSKDIRILLIKLADRLHNMRTLEHMDEDARRRIAQETLDIYAPLAHRLGVDWMRRELVDLAFRTLKPAAAHELEAQIQSGRQERSRFVEEVSGLLSAKLAEAGLHAEVTGREKELASIHAKMEAQRVGIDQIHDVIAFRTILDGPEAAVYQALGVVHALWRPVPGRFKDYVALAKPNGYQSLHTAVIGPSGQRMEVQIRTREMHRNAEFGIAAHWRYKEGGADGRRSDDQKFAWLRQLVERQQELSDPHEFLDTVKVDLFPDEVFVFTPQGDVINLPRGATPVDFAYAIHSQVGERCAGARVNGKLVALRHELRDGDTVEILTSEAQQPRKDWLEFVVSGKARQRIRHATRVAEQARSRELGREMLDKELRRGGLSLARALEDGRLAALAQAELSGAPDDLFSAVGYGRIAAAQVLARLRGDAPPAPPEPERPKRRGLFRRERASTSKSGIRVDGQPDVLVRFAGCCNPLPGDDVVGFVTRGRGVTVHARDCAAAFTQDPDRRIDVEWESKTAIPRQIKVRVVSVDRPGVLARITKSIAGTGVNIGGARVATSDDRTAIHDFDLWVTDLRSLTTVMKEIERVRGVLTVERVRG
ncbi:MAG: bifunctional (p)ppGpp synthetase/guanosine-3',5'-bis(diphosphate) 3'-pyrophosphohydrolase [Deltaproteobacteria bacterium]|nr:bifunctional (p)ppGpp synthetase/guanosine-3',5'-bis(diphosphate) 3'-pyrophosphohydrolase [Deltaproteobacteria bacterium]